MNNEDEICKMLRDQVINAAKISVKHPQDKDKIYLMLLGTIFKKVKEKCANSAEFALLHRVFYANFNNFIDCNSYIKNAIGPNLINAIKQTFAAYKSQNP